MCDCEMGRRCVAKSNIKRWSRPDFCKNGVAECNRGVHPATGLKYCVIPIARGESAG